MKTRTKRVTEPLDEKAKTRLLAIDGYVSSGTDHDGADLTCVLDGIFFSDEDDGTAGEDGGHDNPCEEMTPWSAVETAAVVQGLVKEATADPFAVELAAAAARAGGPALPRALMGLLRQAGYNAGLCKARWEARGGVRGSYEYVDVLQDNTRQRYVVELDFKGQFEIARPTAEYEEVVAGLPRVFVGRPDGLRRLVRVLADAAKRSLQRRELHVPPWRKSGYMQAKWLGPYRRTTNPVPSGSAAAVQPPLVFTAGADVKSRHVGFDAAASIFLPLPMRVR